MNYLAHLFLAQRRHYSILGNLMGDFVRDTNLNELPQAVVSGIKNHKEVDRYTDSHLIVRQLKNVFSNRRRRFAGIVLDVAFDYYLIKHWREFSNEELSSFIRYCYDVLQQQQDLMPERMRLKVSWMVSNDLLNSYATLDGVDRALNGISSRIRFENGLAGGVEEIKRNYHVIEKGFMEFFTQMCDHLAGRDIENANPPNKQKAV